MKCLMITIRHTLLLGCAWGRLIRQTQFRHNFGMSFITCNAYLYPTSSILGIRAHNRGPSLYLVILLKCFRIIWIKIKWKQLWTFVLFWTADCCGYTESGLPLILINMVGIERPMFTCIYLIPGIWYFLHMCIQSWGWIYYLQIPFVPLCWLCQSWGMFDDHVSSYLLMGFTMVSFKTKNMKTCICYSCICYLNPIQLPWP